MTSDAGTFKSKINVTDNGNSNSQLKDITFIWFIPMLRPVMLKFEFCDFARRRAYLAVSSITGTFKVLSFITVLFQLQIQTVIDNGESHSQLKDIVFIWFMPKTDQ